MADKPTVFISYSSRDREWKDRLLIHLRALEAQGAIEVADDSLISAGEDWRSAIGGMIERSAIAVVLVSADYLSSEFVIHEEIPRLLERRGREGARIIPLILRPCDWEVVPWLSRFQVLPRGGVPLSSLEMHEADEVLAQVARELRGALSAVVKDEERRKVQARVEGTAAEYINSSLDELRRREKADRRLAHTWYTIGYGSLVLGAAVSIWRIYRLGSLPSGWPTLVEFAALGVVAVGLLLALAKYAFTLDKSFMAEALRHADRIHAISFGHFYLKAFGAQADWNNVKEALQHWNIDRGSYFLAQEPAQFDPKLLETAVEIAKVITARTDPRK